MPWTPSAGEMGPGVHPETPKLVDVSPRAAAGSRARPETQAQKRLSQWGQGNQPPLWLQAGGRVTGSGHGVPGGPGLGMLGPWHQPGPALSPFFRLGLPAHLAICTPVCLSLSVGLHACVTQLPCQQGSACPALRFVASCAAGQAMDESASAVGASPEPSQGRRLYQQGTNSSAGRLCRPCSARAGGHSIEADLGERPRPSGHRASTRLGCGLGGGSRKAPGARIPRALAPRPPRRLQQQ